jgi:alpha-tubulin suppressor-like RCC1 family protein
LTSPHERTGWPLLLTALCALAAYGCERQLEVLTLASDKAHAGAAGSDQSCIGGCEGDSVCSAGRCIGSPALALVATGSRHSCHVHDGALSCWGDNSQGQLGTGDQTSRNTPQHIGTDRDWQTVSAGAHHTCGLRMGTVYCWGDNSQGQLGSGSIGGWRTRPRSVANWTDVVDVRCASDNCCALRQSNGGLYCWGSNLDGSAGIGGTNSLPVAQPARVAPASSFTSAFAVGWGHSCAIRRDHALFCWGGDSAGELGQAESRTASNVPTQVQDDKDWLRVAAGMRYTCGIRRGGALSCWGANDQGQLGIAGSALDGSPIAADIPNPVGITLGWADIAAGAAHTCGLKVSGELYCWGQGSAGQLGISGADSARAPMLVSGAKPWSSVSLGVEHSCATDLEHNVYCWGRNAAGQLGVGDMQDRDEPTLVAGVE